MVEGALEHVCCLPEHRDWAPWPDYKQDSPITPWHTPHRKASSSLRTELEIENLLLQKWLGWYCFLFCFFLNRPLETRERQSSSCLVIWSCTHVAPGWLSKNLQSASHSDQSRLEARDFGKGGSGGGWCWRRFRTVGNWINNKYTTKTKT